MKAILALLPPPSPTELVEGAAQAEEPELKLAIVGRRKCRQEHLHQRSG